MASYPFEDWHNCRIFYVLRSPISEIAYFDGSKLSPGCSSYNVLTYLFTTYLLTYLHTYLLTYLLTYVITYLSTYLLTYLSTYLLIYLLNYLLTYLLTHPLTHSMQQSLWEANWFSVSQEIPRILWNPNVHYRIHNCLPTVPFLRQIDQVHTTTSYFLKIHLNIIIPSTPGSPKWSLSLWFPHQNSVYASLHPHTRYMPRPSNYFRFDHPNNTGWSVQIIKLRIM